MHYSQYGAITLSLDTDIHTLKATARQRTTLKSPELVPGFLIAVLLCCPEKLGRCNAPNTSVY